MASSYWRLALVLPVLTFSLAAQGAREEEDYDRPDLREAWELQRGGGEPTQAYLQWKGRVAAQELRKQAKAQPAVRSLATQSLVDPLTWTNLGPSAQPAAEHQLSGRILTILTHPTDPKILYVGTAGGGVYKCVNADLAAANWTWTALTDALPNASANGDITVNALAMDPQNPNVIYMGLGGVNADSQLFYASQDGGATWTQGGALAGAQYVGSVMALGGGTVLVTSYDGLWRSTDGGLHFTRLTVGTETVTQVYSLQRFGTQELLLGYDAAPAGGGANQGRIAWSADGGATWTRGTLDSGATAQGLTSITVATGAATSNTAYAVGLASATGALAKGVLKSQDKGHTWTWVAAPVADGSLFQYGGGTDAQYPWNQMLTVDPTNPGRLFAGANKAVYRSLDGGQSWAPITDPMGFTTGVWIHADLHAATWSKTGAQTLFLGNDGGISVLKDPFRATVPTAQDDASFADNSHNVGLVTHLIYGLGSTTAAYPADARSRISLGLQDNGTLIREDAGAGLAASGTFSHVEGGDGFCTLIHPLNGDLVVSSHQSGSIIRSTDGGQTFAPASVPGPGAEFYTFIGAHPADPTGNTLFTVQSDGLYKSADFGATWSLLTANQSASLPGNPALNTNVPFVAGAPSDLNTLAALGFPAWDGTGTIGYTSNDGGATWRIWGVPTGGMVSPVSIAFDPKDAQTIYVSGASMRDPQLHHLWKSVNGGQSFVSIDGTAAAGNGLPYGIPVHVVKADPFAANTVYAATDLGLYRSTDGGTSWAKYGTGLPMVAVRDLYVAPDGTFLRAGTFGRGVWELKLKDPGTATAAIGTPAADLTVTGGTATSFAGSGTGSGTLSYVWDFGDGSSATGATASHTYANDGASPLTYTARFFVKDATGAQGAASRTITVNPPPDTTAPTVSVGCNGTSGTIQFTANATDNMGVTKIEFWVDGVYKGIASRGIAGTFMNFDSTTIANGGHTLAGKAYDAAGNVGSSTPLAFTVSNGPATFQEVESNNTIATANVVATNFAVIQGNPASTSDPDYFALTVAPGQKLSIAMTGPSGTGLDWDLYLKNASGTNLASSTGSTTTENLSWTNTGSAAVTVYANVVAYSGTSATPYSLALTYGGTVDTTLPTATASESGTSGTITLSATASDNVGVTKVEFYVDGTLKGTDTSSPYSVTLDSTTLANGSHTLVAKAYDAAGNVGSSSSVAFSVSNPVADTTAPTVSASEAGTSGTITLSATASDNVGGSGMAKVEFYVDGVLKGTDTTSPYSATLDSTTLANGSHALVAKAYDVAGNSASSSSVAFSVSNPVADTTAPTVSASETGTSGTITLSATASDNVGGSGMAKVEFYVDGALKATDTSSPYSATLDSTTLADGSHALVAKAYDVAGNSASSSSVAFSVNNGGSLAQNEAESNNTTGTANVVATSGTTVTGYISSSTDTDYFQVTVPAGHTLTATLTPPASSDFDLKIYNTTSTTAIASSTNGAGQVDTASTANTGSTSVVRYIQVKYYSGASTTQSYKLKLTF